MWLMQGSGTCGRKIERGLRQKKSRLSNVVPCRGVVHPLARPCLLIMSESAYMNGGLYEEALAQRGNLEIF